MIHTNLYNAVLIDPILKRSADTLKIVTGYTSPAMCQRHIEDLTVYDKKIKINLIVGMTANDGIYEGDHIAFAELMVKGYKDSSVECSYIFNKPGVHSKIYVWEKDGEPIEAYMGSANYSQSAFIINNTRESLEQCDPNEAVSYYNSLDADRMFCNHPDIEDVVNINKVKRSALKKLGSTSKKGTIVLPTTRGGIPASFVKLSLLDRHGQVPPISGLNWGQRAGRDPNQAYITVKKDVLDMKFFPNRKEQFTVLTDDGKAIICVTAQSSHKNDPLSYYKAIHSATNNSLLGEYFRYRLGLASGTFVETDDVLKYGRTDVTFYKIDPETYYMDFSVK